MKLLVVILAYFAFVTNGETFEEFAAASMKQATEIGLQCAAKLKISEATIQELRSKKLPTTHEGKCVLSCIAEHFGFLDAQGIVHKDKVIEHVAPLKEIDTELYQKLEETMETCLGDAKKEEDTCEMAANLLKCSIDDMKSKGVSLEFLGIES